MFIISIDFIQAINKNEWNFLNVIVCIKEYTFLYQRYIFFIERMLNFRNLWKI